MMFKKIWIFIIFIPFSVFSQSFINFFSPHIENIKRSEYKGGTQIWAITQDADGLIYVASNGYISIYDGENWESTPLDRSMRDFFIYKNKIYFVARNKIGYLRKMPNGKRVIVDLTDRFQKITHNKFPKLGNIWFISVVKDIIFFSTDSLTFALDLKRENYALLKQDSYIDTFANNLLFYNWSKTDFYTFDFENFEFVKDTLFKKFLKDRKIISLYYDQNNLHFIAYHYPQKKLSIELVKYNLKTQKTIFKKLEKFPTDVYSFHFTQDSLILVGSLSKGLFIYDLNGNFKSQINTSDGISSNTCFSIFEDKNRLIWLGTNSGISLIYYNLPLVTISKNRGIKASSVLVAKKIGDLFFIGSGYGMYLLNSKLKTKQFKKIGRGQFWKITNFGDTIYFAHNVDIMKYDPQKDTAVYLNLIDKNVWFLKRFFDTRYLFAGTNGKLYLLKKENDELKIVKKFDQIIGNYRDIYIDKDSTIWIVILDFGVIRLKFDPKTEQITVLKKYDTHSGLFNLGNLEFLVYDDKKFVLCNTKLLQLNEQADTFQRATYFGNLIPENISITYVDSLNNFWLNDLDSSLLFVIKKTKDGNFIRKSILKEPPSYIRSITKNFILIALDEGIFIFNYPKFEKFTTAKPNILISKVVLVENDSVLFYYNKNRQKNNYLIPKISYDNNSIKFYFALNTFLYRKNTEFSFKLENFDKNWSKWTSNNFKEYTNLPPGKYIFKVKGRNIFNTQSDIAEFEFVILPPWYRTTYAYAAYFLLFIFFLWGLKKFFTYNLQRRNERLEQIIHQRTKEIEEKNKVLEKQKQEIEKKNKILEKQKLEIELKNKELEKQKAEIELKNAELEQQKEEILTQAEELEFINKELQKLSLIVQETDNAVILTDKDGNFVWVNPAFTKIFGYTLEELINEVSPKIIADRTDPKIKAAVQKCINEKTTVEYEMKVKNKAGKEIWVHVTLTPILDDERNIIGLIAIDSDITKLKEAEERIKQQNESIKASIRYAQTIQKSILPTEEDLNQLFEAFVIFRPKDIVSGDFYWRSYIYDLDKQIVKQFTAGTYVFFAVADCTGHGVPGAFMSLIGIRLLSEIVQDYKNHKPSSVLYSLDKKLKEVIKHDRNYVRDGLTISLCRFDKIEDAKTTRISVTFSGAKHSIIYYKQNEDKFYKIRSAARQIGFTYNEDIEFTDQKFMLQTNDMIFMYSDGLKDLNNKKRQSFGSQRFLALLEANKDKSMPELKQIINNAIDEWVGSCEQRDDITIIGFRIK